MFLMYCTRYISTIEDNVISIETKSCDFLYILSNICVITVAYIDLMIKVGAVLEDLGKKEDIDALVHLAKAFHTLSVLR